MLKDKSNILFFLALALLLLTNKSISAQTFLKKLKLDVSLGTVYDDNLLKNSEKYTERFINNQDQGRFHIKTYDDVFVKSNVRASYYFKFIKNYKTQISGSLLVNSYINNSVKNWMLYSVGLQQYFSKKGSFKLSYSYIPKFYVRHFRDDDLVSIYGYEPITFTPYEFAKDNYGFWVQNTFSKKTKIKLNAGFAKYYHNEHYTEYDAQNIALGIKITQTISKKFKMSIGYQNTDSKAKGYDEVGEQLENSDEADASYKEHKFDAGVSLSLPHLKKRRNSVNLSARFLRRDFSADKPIHRDPLHVNRVDANFSLVASYTISLAKKTKLNLFYNRIQRDSYNNSGIYDDLLSEEKDYKQNQLGFKLTYSIF
jgi:hypothetical protein